MIHQPGVESELRRGQPDARMGGIAGLNRGG